MFRNGKEARLNGVKWAQGRVAAHDIGRQVTDPGGTVDQAK